jgi:hypothetical protein
VGVGRKIDVVADDLGGRVTEFSRSLDGGHPFGTDDLGRALFEGDPGSGESGFVGRRDAMLKGLAGDVNTLIGMAARLVGSGGEYDRIESWLAGLLGGGGRARPVALGEDASRSPGAFRLPASAGGLPVTVDAPDIVHQGLWILERAGVGCAWPNGDVGGARGMAGAAERMTGWLEEAAEDVRGHARRVTDDGFGEATSAFGGFAHAVSGEGGSLREQARSCRELAAYCRRCGDAIRSAQLQVLVSAVFVVALMSLAPFLGAGFAAVLPYIKIEGTALRIFLRILQEAVIGAVFSGGLDVIDQLFHGGKIDAGRLWDSVWMGGLAGGLIRGSHEGLGGMASRMPAASRLVGLMEDPRLRGSFTKLAANGTVATGAMFTAGGLTGHGWDLKHAAENGFGMALIGTGPEFVRAAHQGAQKGAVAARNEAALKREAIAGRFGRSDTTDPGAGGAPGTHGDTAASAEGHATTLAHVPEPTSGHESGVPRPEPSPSTAPEAPRATVEKPPAGTDTASTGQATGAESRRVAEPPTEPAGPGIHETASPRHQDAATGTGQGDGAGRPNRSQTEPADPPATADGPAAPSQPPAGHAGEPTAGTSKIPGADGPASPTTLADNATATADSPVLRPDHAVSPLTDPHSATVRPDGRDPGSAVTPPGGTGHEPAGSAASGVLEERPSVTDRPAEDLARATKPPLPPPLRSDWKQQVTEDLAWIRKVDPAIRRFLDEVGTMEVPPEYVREILRFFPREMLFDKANGPVIGRIVVLSAHVLKFMDETYGRNQEPRVHDGTVWRDTPHTYNNGSHVRGVVKGVWKYLDFIWKDDLRAYAEPRTEVLNDPLAFSFKGELPENLHPAVRTGLPLEIPDPAHPPGTSTPFLNDPASSERPKAPSRWAMLPDTTPQTGVKKALNMFSPAAHDIVQGHGRGIDERVSAAIAVHLMERLMGDQYSDAAGRYVYDSIIATSFSELTKAQDVRPGPSALGGVATAMGDLMSLNETNGPVLGANLAPMFLSKPQSDGGMDSRFHELVEENGLDIHTAKIRDYMGLFERVPELRDAFVEHAQGQMKFFANFPGFDPRVRMLSPERAENIRVLNALVPRLQRGEITVPEYYDTLRRFAEREITVEDAERGFPAPAYPRASGIHDPTRIHAESGRTSRLAHDSPPQDGSASPETPSASHADPPQSPQGTILSEPSLAPAPYRLTEEQSDAIFKGSVKPDDAGREAVGSPARPVADAPASVTETAGREPARSPADTAGSDGRKERPPAADRPHRSGPQDRSASPETPSASHTDQAESSHGTTASHPDLDPAAYKLTEEQLDHIFVTKVLPGLAGPSRAKPTLVCVTGPMASGKSTAMERSAEYFDVPDAARIDGDDFVNLHPDFPSLKERYGYTVARSLVNPHFQNGLMERAINYVRENHRDTVISFSPAIEWFSEKLLPFRDEGFRIRMVSIVVHPARSLLSTVDRFEQREAKTSGSGIWFDPVWHDHQQPAIREFLKAIERNGLVDELIIVDRGFEKSYYTNRLLGRDPVQWEIKAGSSAQAIDAGRSQRWPHKVFENFHDRAISLMQSPALDAGKRLVVADAINRSYEPNERAVAELRAETQSLERAINTGTSPHLSRLPENVSPAARSAAEQADRTLVDQLRQLTEQRAGYVNDLKHVVRAWAADVPPWHERSYGNVSGERLKELSTTTAQRRDAMDLQIDRLQHEGRAGRNDNEVGLALNPLFAQRREFTAIVQAISTEQAIRASLPPERAVAEEHQRRRRTELGQTTDLSSLGEGR